ncbi:EAL domain-containing protein [Sulfurimonas sp.]|uniref:EAL domain-containing protein n=1 Tax=Sulfurimonas sp. TaxID=2022749 RepID=UPI002AB0465A|nr:EAL domain-containing protein [Sulfurimonas sp.]
MHLNSNIITTIMANGDYGVCYEPIICVEDMQIIGYEALSRFKFFERLVSPSDFFKSIHSDKELFFYVETILKKFQLDSRPCDKKLFLNLDPDVAIDSNHIAFWVKLFNASEKIIIEIIENSDEESAEDIEYFMDWLDEYNIPYAYDDYAKPNSMFFTSLLHRADTIKLDIDFLKTIKENNAYIEVAKGVVKYAKLVKKHTVLEGVETKSDLELAKEIGVDFVQGYLFKQEFITVWKN